MNPDDMADHVMTFLRSLHETGWDDGIDALFCGVAEVEAELQEYSEQRTDKLATELRALTRFHRQQNRAKDN